MKTAPAPRHAAASETAIEVPRHICDAIAARADVSRRRADGADDEALAAWRVVRAAEALVLAALPKRLDEPWLEEILRLVPGGLREAFGKTRGVTPYRAIMAARLEAARQTLALYPGLPMLVVATQCGFPGAARFLSEWQAYFGDEAPMPHAKGAISSAPRPEAGEQRAAARLADRAR